MTASPLAARAVIRISPTDGEDSARAFLQGLVTNDVTGELPVYAALLSAQGKHLFDFLVWADGEDLLLDCEADLAEDLVRRLSLYRLRRKLAVGRDESLAVFWSLDGEGVDDPRLALLGKRRIGPASDGPGADGAWLAHRLSHGVAEGRAELGDLLWLETNAAELNGVSFTKGCYIGQENTARMNWRQKVNRRLVVVPLSQSDEKRRRAAYPDLGLAVDHRRVEDITPEITPPWLASHL